MRRPASSVSSDSMAEYPRHFPSHEVAIADAFRVRSLGEDGKGYVARMEVGEVTDLRADPGTTLALVLRRATLLPHEIVGNELPAALKGIQQGHRPIRPREGGRRADFHGG